MSWDGHPFRHVCVAENSDRAADLSVSYASNALNQYRFLTYTPTGMAPGLAYDADGNLIREFGLQVGDTDCDGDADFFDIDAFVAALGRPCPDPNWPYACPCRNFDADDDGDIDFFDIDPFTGHLGESAVTRSFEWDAENRLIRVGPVAGYEMAGDVQVTFADDSMSRRVAKRVHVCDPNASPAWVLTKDRRFIWDGWLMLREIDQNNAPALAREFLSAYASSGNASVGSLAHC